MRLIDEPYKIGTQLKNKADNDTKKLTAYMITENEIYLILDGEKVLADRVKECYEVVNE